MSGPTRARGFFAQDWDGLALDRSNAWAGRIALDTGGFDRFAFPSHIALALYGRRRFAREHAARARSRSQPARAAAAGRWCCLALTFPDGVFVCQPETGVALARDFQWTDSHQCGCIHLGGAHLDDLMRRGRAASALIGWPAPFRDRPEHGLGCQAGQACAADAGLT